MDDIVIQGRNPGQHLQHTEAVLQILKGPEADTAAKCFEQLTCSDEKGIRESMEAAVYMTCDKGSRIRTARHLSGSNS